MTKKMMNTNSTVFASRSSTKCRPIYNGKNVPVDTNISAQNLLILGGWLIVNYILFTVNVGETTVMFTAYVPLKSHLLNYLLME